MWTRLPARVSAVVLKLAIILEAYFLSDASGPSNCSCLPRNPLHAAPGCNALLLSCAKSKFSFKCQVCTMCWSWCGRSRAEKKAFRYLKYKRNSFSKHVSLFLSINYYLIVLLISIKWVHAAMGWVKDKASLKCNFLGTDACPWTRGGKCELMSPLQGAWSQLGTGSFLWGWCGVSRLPQKWGMSAQPLFWFSKGNIDVFQLFQLAKSFSYEMLLQTLLFVKLCTTRPLWQLSMYSMCFWTSAVQLLT